MNIFRREAVEAHAGGWVGVVHLRSSPSMVVTACIAVTLALLLVAFATLGHTSRKTRLVGLLVPAAGAVSIQARDAGTVVESHVIEGQAVNAGDVLLVLDTGRLSRTNAGLLDAGQQIDRAITQRIEALDSQRLLREQQYAIRVRSIADRTGILDAQYQEGGEEQRLLGRRLELAQASVERQEALAKAGFVSAAQIQSKQEDLLDAASRLQSVRRNLLGIANDRSALAAEKEGLLSQLKLDAVDIDRAIQSARQESVENSARRLTAITAPATGVVSAIDLALGQAVQPGQTLLTLVAEGDRASGAKSRPKLVAHLYAPSRAIGFLRPQQPVFLRYDAYPFEKFGTAAGVIVSVSESPFAPNELPPNLAQQLTARTGAHDGLFRAVVQLDSQQIRAHGTEWPLKAGMVLDADVKHEERAIWEWVLQPVLALKRV